MVEYARKYPFLFILPSLIGGILIGERFLFAPKLLTLITLLLIIISYYLYRNKKWELLVLSYPIITLYIGVLIYSTELGDNINIVLHENIQNILSPIKQYFTEKNYKIIHNNEASALVNAICLGEKSGMHYATKTLFNECGIMHLVAVSGLHIGAIYMMINKISNRKYLSLTFIWIYSLIIGASPSAIRASAILTYISIAESFNKSYSSLNGILCCAFITLIFAPETIHSISFQLSYGAYMGIITIFPLFVPPKKTKGKFIKYLISTIGVSVAAQVATLPIILYYFNGISINSYILNIVAIPMASLILYLDIFALITPIFLSRLIGYLLSIMGEGLIFVTKLMEPVNVFVGEVSIGYPTIILYYCGVGGVFYCIKLGIRN